MTDRKTAFADTASDHTALKDRSPGLPVFYDMEFHRGGRDARPENTLYSYQYALERGAATIECDMQMTKDGVIVMSHNPVLDPDITVDRNGLRIRAGQHRINQMTLEEVRSFNVGNMDRSSEYYRLHGVTQIQADARIPTLRELFRLVRDSGDPAVRMNIETKSYPDPALGEDCRYNTDMSAMVREFYRLVREFGFEQRVMLQSFDWSSLVIMRNIDPSIRTVALYCEEDWGSPGSDTLWRDRNEASPWLAGLDIRDFAGDPVQAAHALGIHDISPYFEELTPAQVQAAHALGMKVIPWTVNRVDDMEKLYRMGADGIISDRPWLLREFLESVGENLPEDHPARALALPYHLEGDHREV